MANGDPMWYQQQMQQGLLGANYMNAGLATTTTAGSFGAGFNQGIGGMNLWEYGGQRIYGSGGLGQQKMNEMQLEANKELSRYLDRIQQEKQPVDMKTAKYMVVAGGLNSYYGTEEEALRAASLAAGGKTEQDAYVFKAIKLVRPKPKEVESVDL